MARIPRDAYQAALKRAQRWLTREDVIGVGIGVRSRNGELVDTEVCIVVTVLRKRSPQRLQALKVKPLASEIEVVVRGKSYRIPVDVEDARGSGAGRLHGIIGAPLRAANLTGPGARQGVVGAVVAQNGVDLVLAAGHVVLNVGVRVRVIVATKARPGTAASVFLKGNLDHALVELDEPLSGDDHTLPPGQALLGVRDSTGIKMNEDVFFYDRDNTLHQSKVTRTDATAPFTTPGGVKTFRHLIGVPGTSRKGDSGTLLFDDRFRALGTLVGVHAGVDYFLPCDLSFDEIGVVLT